MKKQIGLTDTAALHDQFKIERYIRALTDFIQDCRTPMTISVQGSWGTGKTTVMQIVKSNLEAESAEKKVKTAWFNTWQYSQFSMDDMLAISLLEYVTETCGQSDPTFAQATGKTFRKMLGGLQRFIAWSKGLPLDAFGPVGATAAGVVKIAEQATDSIAEGVDAIRKKGDGEQDAETDPVKAVEDLKRQFDKIIQEALERDKADRFVIFIDDLDRLDPKKAVELLEVLKLFLDSERCVFVLAIDYDVVVRGVQAKYGAETDREFMKQNGQKFFDKIIQVPFRMPTAKYQIDEFLQENLKNIAHEDVDDERLESYKGLI